MVARMIYKDIDHSNLSVHHGTAAVSFMSQEKNLQQPLREDDRAMIFLLYFF